MNRRDFLKSIFTSSAVLLGLSGCSSFTSGIPGEKRQTHRKPNLIVILTDDQGYADLGSYGAKGFTTPNLDRMAEEGVRFTDFYAAPTCSPARASLLTGCYAQRLGIIGPINRPDAGLCPDEITLAELLGQNGYATACIGKWHLGLPDRFSPVAQGFDFIEFV